MLLRTRIASLLTATAVSLAALDCFADMTVSPVRVIFSDREGGEQSVALVNNGDEPETYRVGLIHYIQTPDKGLVEVTRATEAPDVRWADKIVRFSPLSVVIPSKVAQTVRLQTRIPPDLPPGEYRTHLLFTGIPRPQPPQALKRGPGEQRPVRIALSTVYRLAIPVVIWRGPLNAEIKLRNLSFTPAADGNGHIKFTVVRDGDRSVFATVLIRFLPYKGVDAVEIGRITDLAVYHPNTQVNFNTQVVFPPELRGSKGRLILTFLDSYAVPQIRSEESIEIN